MLSILRQSFKKPAVQAAAHLSLTGATLYLLPKAIEYAGAPYIKSLGDRNQVLYATVPQTKEEVFEGLCKSHQLNMETTRLAIGTSVAAMLSPMILHAAICKAMGVPYRLIPSVGKAMPILPRAIAGIGSFCLAPVAALSFGILSVPLILWCNGRENGEGEEFSDASQVSRVPREGKMKEYSVLSEFQASAGTKHCNTFEMILPGSVTLLIPICEESMFRGYLFGHLLPLIGFTRAAASSSLIFALAHKGADGSSYLPIQEFFMGVMSAWVYVRAGSLLVPIAFHCGNNVTTCLLHALRDVSELFAHQYLMKEACERSDLPTKLSPWQQFAALFLQTDGVLKGLFALLSDDSVPIEDQDMIPLATWSDERVVANSICFNHQKQRIFTVGETEQVMGYTREVKDELIMHHLDSVFEEQQTISVKQFLDKTLGTLLFELSLHLMATRPQLFQNMLETGGVVPDECKDVYRKTLLRYIGSVLLQFSNGVVSRTELETLYRKNENLSVMYSENCQDLMVMDIRQNGWESFMRRLVKLREKIDNVANEDS